MTIVRTLWPAAKCVVGGLASLGGLAWLAFVAGGSVWGVAKGITGTMRDPSGWSEWLSIVGGGVHEPRDVFTRGHSRELRPRLTPAVRRGAMARNAAESAPLAAMATAR
jgi:hypothetical protein